MKKILLLLLLTLGATSCSSWELVTTTQSTSTSTVRPAVSWQYGIYGWGYYDTFGRPIYNGFYNFNNYGQFYYGPRVIIRSRGNRPSRSTVATPRGSRSNGTVVNRGRRNKKDKR